MKSLVHALAVRNPAYLPSPKSQAYDSQPPNYVVFLISLLGNRERVRVLTFRSIAHKNNISPLVPIAGKFYIPRSSIRRQDAETPPRPLNH
ncbi:MAG: hypothetical protein M3N42_15475, partial [Cyanobacteriota bacterium]|nr:hypothetical protein [Cyanobacteriota bacterium]